MTEKQDPPSETVPDDETVERDRDKRIALDMDPEEALRVLLRTPPKRPEK